MSGEKVTFLGSVSESQMTSKMRSISEVAPVVVMKAPSCLAILSATPLDESHLVVCSFWFSAPPVFALFPLMVGVLYGRHSAQLGISYFTSLNHKLNMCTPVLVSGLVCYFGFQFMASNTCKIGSNIGEKKSTAKQTTRRDNLPYNLTFFLSLLPTLAFGYSAWLQEFYSIPIVRWHYFNLTYFYLI